MLEHPILFAIRYENKEIDMGCIKLNIDICAIRCRKQRNIPKFRVLEHKDVRK